MKTKSPMYDLLTSASVHFKLSFSTMFPVLGTLEPVPMAIRFHPELQVMMPGEMAQ